MPSLTCIVRAPLRRVPGAGSIVPIGASLSHGSGARGRTWRARPGYRMPAASPPQMPTSSTPIRSLSAVRRGDRDRPRGSRLRHLRRRHRPRGGRCSSRSAEAATSSPRPRPPAPRGPTSTRPSPPPAPPEGQRHDRGRRQGPGRVSRGRAPTTRRSRCRPSWSRARTWRTSPPTWASVAGVPGAAPPKVPGGPGRAGVRQQRLRRLPHPRRGERGRNHRPRPRQGAPGPDRGRRSRSRSSTRTRRSPRAIRPT